MTTPAVSAPSFRVGDAIGYAWKRTWSNFWWLLLVSLLFTVINGAVGLVTAGTSESVYDITSDQSIQEQLQSAGGLAFDIVGSILQVLVTVFLALGVIRIALAVTSGDRVRVGRLWSFEGFGRYLLGAIIIGIIAGIGFLVPLGIGLWITTSTDSVFPAAIGGILGVILAIVVSLGFSLFGYAILAADARGLSSLSQSWKLVRPRFGALLGLHVLLALIGIATFIVAVLAGILLLLVGLLATLPVAGVVVFGLSTFSLAYAYRTLAGQPVA